MAFIQKIKEMCNLCNMCGCIDPFSDHSDIDQLFEDTLLDVTICNIIDNVTMNCVPVKLLSAVGSPTEDPINGLQLVLTGGSKGEGTLRRVLARGPTLLPLTRAIMAPPQPVRTT